KASPLLTKSGSLIGSLEYKGDEPAVLSSLRQSRNRRSLRSRRSLILRATESEDRQGKNFPKRNTHPEPRPFAQNICQVDANDNSYDDIHEWNEHQNHPPTGPTHYFTPHVHIVDRDDSGPAGATGFGKHFPHRHDQQYGDK